MFHWLCCLEWKCINNGSVGTHWPKILLSQALNFLCFFPSACMSVMKYLSFCFSILLSLLVPPGAAGVFSRSHSHTPAPWASPASPGSSFPSPDSAACFWNCWWGIKKWKSLLGLLMIRHMLNYSITTQPGCHHQCCVLDSQPGCNVSLSSQLMKTPFENPWAERITT